jgi:hypothetical protein
VSFGSSCLGLTTLTHLVRRDPLASPPFFSRTRRPQSRKE